MCKIKQCGAFTYNVLVPNLDGQVSTNVSPYEHNEIQAMKAIVVIRNCLRIRIATSQNNLTLR
jgi:hypothetical protein